MSLKTWGTREVNQRNYFQTVTLKTESKVTENQNLQYCNKRHTTVCSSWKMNSRVY